MTEQDFLNIIGNKISYEMQKTIIRNNYAPQTSELLCYVIDSREKADLFQKMMDEWVNYQHRQQQIVQAFYRQYHNR